MIQDKHGELLDTLLPLVLEKYPNRGQHSRKHPLRLMCLVKDFCKKYKLDYATFIVAAALHDIGRTNDKEDTDHGKASLNIVKNKLEITEEAAVLIEEHCRESTNEYVQYFKDLDALDRIRFNGRPWFIKINSDKKEWLARIGELQKLTTQELVDELTFN